MKGFSHGKFTEAFIASVGNMTGIVKDTLELTEICRWYSLKITLTSSIFICGYFSFYTFYYLKSITLKMCTCSDIWQKVNSPYVLSEKRSACRPDPNKDWNPWTEAVKLASADSVCVCVPFFLQTHSCPSPNSVSIFSTKHSLWPDICLQNKHIKSIFSFEP